MNLLMASVIGLRRCAIPWSGLLGGASAVIQAAQAVCSAVNDWEHIVVESRVQGLNGTGKASPCGGCTRTGPSPVLTIGPKEAAAPTGEGRGCRQFGLPNHQRVKCGAAGDNIRAARPGAEVRTCLWLPSRASR